MYEVRQHYFSTKKYKDYYDVWRLFTDTNNVDYRSLPNKVSKAIMYEVDTQPQDGKPYLELNKNGFTSHHTITQHYTNKYTSDTPRYFRVRHLQPLEYFRLQGFTDDQYYKASQETAKGQLYKQAGNSVTVPVIQLILADVIQHINQIKKA